MTSDQQCGQWSLPPLDLKMIVGWVPVDSGPIGIHGKDDKALTFQVAIDNTSVFRGVVGCTYDGYGSIRFV